MHPERIIARIEACLALSASDNEHEARAGIDRAAHLMRRYRVTAAMLGEDARKALASRRYRLAPSSAANVFDHARRSAARVRRTDSVRFKGKSR
ncbi:MAG: DUF2786 domain-containing protein [Sphingomonas oligoaromativorans]